MNLRRAPILFLPALALFGCGYHAMTIDEFHTIFARSCPSLYLIAPLDEKSAQASCSCMVSEAARRWTSIDQLVDSLAKEDRPPRGEGDYIHGAARITFETCKKQVDKQ